MPTGHNPSAAGPDDKSIIHLQSSYCGSPCWRQPNEIEAVLLPGEVYLPFLLAGMKESYDIACLFINKIRACAFVTITTGAGKAQIRLIRASPRSFRKNVLDFKRHTYNEFLSLAIFALVSGTFGNQFSCCWWDVRIAHRLLQDAGIREIVPTRLEQ